MLLPLSCLGLAASLSLASCGPNPTGKSISGGAPAAMEMAKDSAPMAAPADNQQLAKSEAGTSTPTPEGLPNAPKLIKKAALTLIVKSTAEATKTASTLVQEQQGYLIDFQDNRSQVENGQQRVSMQIRLPQERLDSTLAKLSQLGIVKSQSLTAEDVSEQLVDVEARLRNLRKQEELVLKIMERSGSVGEILNVARELSNIRESIERIDAQLKNLKTQVAYSTIYLNLEAPVANAPEFQRPVSLEFKETWEDATEGVGDLTVGLLKFGIWLLTFSPYLALIIGGIYGFRRLKKRPAAATTNKSAIEP
jgi:Domain of unknown function (DUF4349)